MFIAITKENDRGEQVGIIIPPSSMWFTFYLMTSFYFGGCLLSRCSIGSNILRLEEGETGTFAGWRSQMSHATMSCSNIRLTRLYAVEMFELVREVF